VPPIAAEAKGQYDAPILLARESIEHVQAWRLNRRGVWQLPAPRVATTDPLGFFTEQFPSGEAQQITVLPTVVRLDRLGFVGGVAARLQSPQHATVVADAMDFHGVRPWHPGEAIRRVHWKSTARTGQLQIVEWEENVARDLAILLDVNSATLMGQAPDDTLEMSIIIAASIAQHLLEGSYTFQLFCWETAPDGQVKLLNHQAHSVGDLSSTLHMLARVQAVHDGAATLENLTQEALAHLPPGRATLIVSPTSANIAAARKMLAPRGDSGGTCYTIALDAASFETVSSKTKAPLNPRVAYHVPRDPQTRLLRRGEPIAAALEQVA
jgi:uncharacterized protein (DUF58 family)